MCPYSGKDFDADKTVQCSKLWNEMPKSMNVLVQLKLQPKSWFIDSREEGIWGENETRK